MCVLNQVWVLRQAYFFNICELIPHLLSNIVGWAGDSSRTNGGIVFTWRGPNPEKSSEWELWHCKRTKCYKSRACTWNVRTLSGGVSIAHLIDVLEKFEKWYYLITQKTKSRQNNGGKEAKGKFVIVTIRRSANLLADLRWKTTIISECHAKPNGFGCSSPGFQMYKKNPLRYLDVIASKESRLNRSYWDKWKARVQDFRCAHSLRCWKFHSRDPYASLPDLFSESIRRELCMRAF